MPRYPYDAEAHAYRDHGDPAVRLEAGIDEAGAAIEQLPPLGIDLAKITRQLEDDGVAKFTEAYTRLMDTLVERRAKDLAEVAKR